MTCSLAQAYAAGDGRRATELSSKGRMHGDLAHRWRKVVNNLAYEASNSDIVNTFTLDLHGMVSCLARYFFRHFDNSSQERELHNYVICFILSRTSSNSSLE